MIDDGGLRHGVHVGITGTRKKLAPHQQLWIASTLIRLDRELKEAGIGVPLVAGSEIVYFHHGDCIGADEYSHSVVRQLNWPIIIHPPRDDKYRAYCKGAWMVCEEMGYLARNRELVGAVEVLLSVPRVGINHVNSRGVNGRGISGTAYTTMLALDKGAEVLVCPTKSLNGL